MKINVSRSKLTQNGALHFVVPLLAILAVALIGTTFFVVSRADTTNSSAAATTNTSSVCGTNAIWRSSAQFGYYSDGNWGFNNNEWGMVSGSKQTIFVKSTSDWGVCAYQPYTSPDRVKSYPEQQRNIGKPISSFTNISNSADYNLPDHGTWEVADDLWVNGPHGTPGTIEVMIWTYNHNQYPAGQKFTTASIAGHNYDVYKTTSGNHIYTFVQRTNTTSPSMPIMNIFDWLANRGYINKSMDFTQFNFGYEICSTDGMTEEFHTTNFSMELQ